MNAATAGLTRRPIDDSYREFIGKYVVLFRRASPGGWFVQFKVRDDIITDPRHGLYETPRGWHSQTFKVLQQARDAVKDFFRHKSQEAQPQ